MVRLIVGLGNPGQEYEKTRHNVGFLFVDELASDRGADWRQEKRFQGLLASYYHDNKKIWLLKPLTYMNRSGQSVRKLVDYYGIDPEEILVVHDELDFEPGIVRLKKAGGHGGHNGLRDIMAHLGSKNFWRVRVGIGRPQAGRPVADYVLSAPSASDREKIVAALATVAARVNLIVEGQFDRFMTETH